MGIRKRLYFFAVYFMYWLSFFAFFRLVFVIYVNAGQAGANTTIVQLLYHALPLDIAFTSFLVGLPFLILTFWFGHQVNMINKVLRYYNLVILIILSTLLTIDLELFDNWGSHIDITAFQYLEHPQLAFASAQSSPVFVLLSILVLSIILFQLLYGILFKRIQGAYMPLKWYHHTALLVISLCLAITHRGGWQQIAINQSSVFFSKNNFANQSALNVPWNFFYSVTEELYKDKNPYQYARSEALSQSVSIIKPQGKGINDKIVSVQLPNIVLIVWESCTSKLMDSGFVTPIALPHLKRWSKQGVYFDHFYASGERSDKGLTAILSSFPAMSRRSIMKFPEKTQYLPSIAKTLNDEGYKSSFYYGGELNFANMKAYLLGSGFDKLVSLKEFPADQRISKWGIPDHLMFEKLYDDIDREKGRFFKTLFTLSSHEPYDIPGMDKSLISTKEELHNKSMSYTDQALSNFLEKSKKSPWWHNTLIIITADHGHSLPGRTGTHSLDRIKIPLLFTGGAVSDKGLIIDKCGDQTDIAPSLLSQLDLDYDAFHFGKNLFDQSVDGSAYHAFIDGFALLTDSTSLIFHHKSGKIINEEGEDVEAKLQLTKVYTQYVYDYYLQIGKEKP